MGKFLGSLFKIISGVLIQTISAGIGAAIGGPVGLVAAYGLALFGTSRVFSGVSGLLGLGPSAPKPDTTETAIKTARPPRVSAYGESRLYGAYILYETASDGTAVDVYAVHDGRINSVARYYLADDRVTLSGSTVQEGDDGRYADGKVKLYSTNGTTPGAPITAISSKLPGLWTSAHRGDGVVILAATFEAVKAKKYIDTYPNGVPAASMAAQWQLCPDPRAADPLDQSGWTWTENVVRQLMHYMLVRESIDYASKILPTLAYWKHAADVCDQNVAVKAGGAEKRWRSCVSHKHTDTHAEVKASLMKCCDGWVGVSPEGAVIVYAGEFYQPTITIGPDEIVAFEWAGVGRDDDEAANELVCSYVSAEHDYNTVETDSWRNEDDIADRGVILSDTLDPQVPSHGQVRRLAKRQMARLNAIHRGTVTTNAAGRQVRGERYVTLRLIEAGTTFYDGPVEVTEVTRNIMTGGVTFSWVAADPAVDAWNPATEEGSPAPVGNRVAPEPISTPSISSTSAVLSGDGSFAQISVIIDSDDRPDLTWFLRTKLSSNTVWNEAEYSDIDPSTAVQLISDGVPLNSSIDVAVSYSVGDGRTSDWSTTSTVSTSTAALAPSPSTELTATGAVGSATVAWRNPTSSNFSYTRVYRGTTSVFGAATLISGDITGGLGQVQQITDTVAAGTYFYWVRAFSTAGVAASPTGPQSATVT